MDGDGNVFIADPGAHRVRWVDAESGIITTVAGTGEPGFDGDEGPAVQARLNRPIGVAVDGDGNLFIADRGNRRVRRVDGTSGIVTTFAGTGEAGFSGDGGPAAEAQLYEVVGLALDSGNNLLIVDGGTVVEDPFFGSRIVGNHRIRRVDSNTGIISTIAGTGVADFTGDNGPAISAALSFPSRVAVDASGRILISDSGNHRVRMIDPENGIISTFAGVGGDPFTGEGRFSGDGGLATLAGLNSPVGLALDDEGNVFIADQGNNRVRWVDRNGVIFSVAGTGRGEFRGDGGFSFQAGLDLPSGVVLIPGGDLLVADSGNGRIRRLFDPRTLIPLGDAVQEVDFGGVTLETTRGRTVSVRNVGNAPLGIREIRSDNPLFVVRDTSLTLAVGDSLVVSLSFNPETPVRVEGSLTILTNDPVGRLSVALRGLGTIPDILLLDQSINFLPLVIGLSDTLEVTLFNRGIGDLFVRSVTSSDAQFTSLDTLFSLSSGQNRSLRVIFSPAVVGEQTGTLTIESNDPDAETVTLDLRGVGRPAKPGGFTAIGDSLGLGGNGREFGVAWGDYNGDGSPDLYIARSLLPGSLHRNNGDRTFTDMAAGLNVTNDRDGSAPLWGDYDNDGDLDLFVTNFNEPNRLYRNDGTGFVDVAGAAGLDAATAGMGGAWADYDIDGDLDLFVANFGPDHLYRNDGGLFVDVSSGLGLVDSLGSSVQPAWADYDLDGDPDLYVAASGRDRFFENDNGLFQEIGDSLMVIDHAPSFGAAWGDYDNDADLDLFVTGFNTVSHLYRNDGGSFEDVEGRLFFEDDGTWKARGAVWIDFDNDGDMDIYIVRSNQTNLLYRNDGGAFIEVGEELGVDLLGDGRGAAVSDFDGDGAPDLYVANQDGPGRLYWNREALGGWLAAQLVGSLSSTDAIGTRVLAVFDGRPLLQEVSGGSSHLSQSGAVLLFGAGRAEFADTLTVRWPSGIVQVLNALPEGRLTRIVETPPSPASRIELTTSATELIANGVSTARLTASVLDARGERSLSSRATITFGIDSGQGRLEGPLTVEARDGVASILFRSPDLVPGRTAISARSPGLTSGRVEIDLFPTPAGGAIDVAAGSGLTGLSGDGGPAIEAGLSLPEGVAVADTLGTIYIADTNNSAVRRVDGGSGVISTLAGNGVRGSGGDGGPASEARLNTPSDVLVTSDNRLLIVDTGNHRIRQIDLDTGIISTLVGVGFLGSEGDGGPGAEANLFFPTSAALDPLGNLYIVDTNNHRIRRVDRATDIITTVAGDGTAGYSGDDGPAFRASLNQPQGIAFDPEGRLYIADTENHRIRRVDLVTGTITTVVGDGQNIFAGDGGPAREASLNGPRRLAIGPGDDIYIADTGNHRLRRVDAKTGLITTLAGTGVVGFNGREEKDAREIQLNEPVGIALKGTEGLFLTDRGNHLVRRLTLKKQEVPIDSVTSDFDGDGQVGLEDFFLFVEKFGTMEGEPTFDASFDLVKDGTVDFNDFFVFAGQFGRRRGKPAFFSR